MTVILGEFSMEYKVCSLVRMMNEVFTLFQTHMPALMNLQMELEAAYKKTLLAKK
jgi:hypothetical protein